jgi:hypothetical protein
MYENRLYEGLSDLVSNSQRFHFENKENLLPVSLTSDSVQ